MRYRLSYAEVSEWLAERGVLVDQSTIYRWVQGFLLLFGEAGANTPRPRRSRLAGRRDVSPNPRALALHLPRHRRTRPDRGRLCVADARHGCRAQVLRAGNCFQWDYAASGHHRQGSHLSTSVGRGGAWRLHRTGRYRTNGLERDHGFHKERLRPMRGLKSVASAAIFMRGHALMRNIRRRFYRLVESVPQRLVFAWTWSRLAEAV